MKPANRGSFRGPCRNLQAYLGSLQTGIIYAGITRPVTSASSTDVTTSSTRMQRVNVSAGTGTEGGLNASHANSQPSSRLETPVSTLSAVSASGNAQFGESVDRPASQMSCRPEGSTRPYSTDGEMHRVHASAATLERFPTLMPGSSHHPSQWRCDHCCCHEHRLMHTALKCCLLYTSPSPRD